MENAIGATGHPEPRSPVAPDSKAGSPVWCKSHLCILGTIDSIKHPECLLSLLPCKDLTSYPGGQEMSLIPYALNSCSSPRAENPCPDFTEKETKTQRS